jgi:ketosteroid isomerase-like protein
MTDAATMRAVTMRYFECVNTENWPGMREIWCEDGEFRAVGARPRQDRDSVVAFFGKLFSPWKYHDDHPTRLVVSENDATVLAEVTFTGRTDNGREVTFDAVDVFDFAGGRIRKITNWYDIDYARRALK